MYCNNCGTQNPDGATFCTKCGAFLTAQSQQPQQPQQQWQAQQQWQPQQQWQQPANPLENNMKWHKFLIFFALWASGVLNIITGILALTGAQYEMAADVSAELVYWVYPSMKTWDVLYGILLIAVGAFSIFVRFQLAGWKKAGPKYLLWLYAAAAIVGLLYVIAAASVVGGDMLDASTISSLVVSVVMIIVNRIYYQKRASLFVN